MKHWRGWLIFAFVLLVFFYVLSHSYVFMTVGGLLVLLLIIGVCVFGYAKWISVKNRQ